jgi:hypothetical protein
LARIEGQLTFEAIVRRTSNTTPEPGPIVWRDNLGLRGLNALLVTFDAVESNQEMTEPIAPAATMSGCPFHRSA